MTADVHQLGLFWAPIYDCFSLCRGALLPVMFCVCVYLPVHFMTTQTASPLHCRPTSSGAPAARVGGGLFSVFQKRVDLACMHLVPT